MSTKQIPLTLVVAATTKNGIGKGGALPWPMLKNEMAYFARVTKRVPMPSNTGSVQSDLWLEKNLEGTRRNVVIMGRKTWDSIPTKFRPLKDRTNVVITSQTRRQLGDLPEEVIVSSNILSALESLEDTIKDGKALPVGRAFVIGGSSIYAAALDLSQTKSILLTHVQRDFDCDTFFPVDLNDSSSGWERASHRRLEEVVGEAVSVDALSEGTGENATTYEFQLYERS